MVKTLQLLLFILVVFFSRSTISIGQTASFTASSTLGCGSLAVSFDASGSTGSITTYSWNLGNSVNTTGQYASTIYAPGTYTVRLIVSGPSGADTTTTQITVYNKPSVNFGVVKSSGCAPFAAQFAPTVTVFSPGTPTYYWDYGDGNSGSTPNHTYASAGTYSVSLRVTDGSSCDSLLQKFSFITVFPVPNASFSTSKLSFCSLPAVDTFTNTSSGGTGPFTSYWTFGDGGLDSGASVSHTYTTGPGFNVYMTIKDVNGCISQSNNTLISINTTQAVIAGPPSICLGQTAFFNNNTPGGTTNTAWNFGDGSTSFGTSGPHNYALTGSYVVSMSCYIGSCFRIAPTKSIIVNPQPSVSFSYIKTVPCPSPDSIILTAVSNNGTIFNWYNRYGALQSSSNPYVRHYSSNSIDYLTLIVRNSFGCVDSVTDGNIMYRGIIVNILPGAPSVPDDPSPYAGCVPLTVNFSVNLFSTLPPPPAPGSYFPYPDTAISWEWDFGDGSPKDYTANPTHVYPNVGTDTVYCKIVTSNGCNAIGRRIVHIDTKIHPSFYASPLIICPKDTIIFYNTTVTTLTNLAYTWDIGENNFTVLNKNPIKYAYQKPGDYDIKLYCDHKGCIDTAHFLKYITVHPPEAKFDYLINCPPSLVVNFTNSSLNATSQLWNFGDGSTDTSFSPVHTYANPGTYSVKFTAYNSVYNCQDIVTKVINIYTSPIDFQAIDSTICVGDAIQLGTGFLREGTVNFSWSIDGGAPTVPSTTPIISNIFLSKGKHTVKLRATSGNNCVDSLVKVNYIIVSQPDVHFFASPPIACQPGSIKFKDTSTNVQGVGTNERDWTFGDGSLVYITAKDTVSNVYYFKGDYNVTLVVTDSQGCKDSLTRTQYVSIRKPVAGFQLVKDSVCTHAAVLITSSSTARGPITYAWNFGDHTTGITQNPTHIYTDTGNLVIKLKVTDSVGCTDTISSVIYANGPHAGFVMSDSLAICPPLIIHFTDTSFGASSWSWNFATGGGPVVVQNPIKTFSNAGLYNIYQVAINANGCTDTARSVLRVLGYNGGFNYSPTDGCVPLVVAFTPPTNGIPKITWDFGDGSTLVTNGTGISHTYNTTGKYLPKVIFSDGLSCNALSNGLKTITVDKVFADFSWTVPCIGTPFQLTDKSTAVYTNPNNWDWNFGGGNTTSGPTTSYNYMTSGNQGVKLVVTNSLGCKDSITKQVMINPLPIVVASPDQGLCPGDSTKLWVKGAVSYQWSPSNLVGCVNCDTTKVFNRPDTTTYYVTGTDANGCVNKDSTRVYIQYITTNVTGPGGAICVGDTFHLFASGADTYKWTPSSSLDSPFIATPNAFPLITTIYTLEAQKGSCIKNFTNVTVTVNPIPIFSAGPDQLLVRGGAVALHPTKEGIEKIIWRTDTTLSCLDCFTPNAFPKYSRIYYATGVDKNGCSVTDSVQVFVRCNGELVFIPNTFSPNGDGNNDYFYPRGEGVDQMYSFRIYNRWGQMVFERNKINLNDELAGWDGTFKGQSLAPDVYVYVMQSICEDGKVLNWKGDITLMR